MHLFTQSALLQALGWSLFDSFWQMALLWLLYVVFTSVFPKASSHARHNLALILLGAGAVWFLFSFIAGFSGGNEGRSSFSWPGKAWAIQQLLPYLSSLYLLILCVLLARYIHHYFQSRRLKLTGLSRIRPDLRLFVEETSRRLGIRKEVRIWMSSLVDCPLTLGFLKPVILVPVATITHLTTQQVETILLHELAHIKRYDYLLNLAIMALEIVFFFNPFSRLLIRGIKKEREHRCDDLVMQFRYDPHTYVSALLSLATHGQGRERLALAANGRNDQLLLQRAKRLLKDKKTADRPGARSIVFLLLALLTTFLGLSRPAISVPPQSATGTGIGIAMAPPLPASEVQAVTILSTALPIVRSDQAKTGAPKPKGLKKAGSIHSTLSGTHEAPENIYYVNAEAPEDEDDNAEDNTVVTAMAAPAPEAAEHSRRSYSISPAVTMVTPPPPATNKQEPYVPNSSFSFTFVEDTARPGRRIASLDKSFRAETERALRTLDAAIRQLEAQLRSVEGSLRALQPGNGYSNGPSSSSLARSQQEQLRALEKQLRQEQSNLSKQLNLQRKLEIKLETSCRKVIVHI